jgi:PAS domain S-box-containing protein
MAVVGHPESTDNVEVRRLRTLYQLLADFSRARVLEDVYQVAITSLLRATSADRAAILIFDDDGVMRFKAWRNLSPEYRQAVTGHSPWPKGTPDAEPLVVPDALLDESLLPFRDVLTREGIRALAFVPLALEAGVFGKFMLYYGEPHQCTPDELEIAGAIAAHVALATQHKRAELACARSERSLHAILDNAASVIFLKDIEGRYLLVNRRFEELFHISKAEVIGRTDHDIFPAAIADRFRENDQKVLAAGKALAVEESAPHDDGLHSYISMKFPLDGPDPKANGICGIATDITERKQLEAAQLHLAAIVESSEDAIASKDLNGIITSWNQGAERLFGYTAAEAVGKPVSMLAPPECFNEMPVILSRIRQGQRVDHYETRRRRKDGETIDVSLTVSPIRNRSGEVIGASKIARDITERKRAEKERALLLAREQDARRTAELLNLAALRFAAQLDTESLAREVTDIATALAGAEAGWFFHNAMNEKGETQLLCTVSGTARKVGGNGSMVQGSVPFAPVLRENRILRCDDITEDSRYEEYLAHFSEGGPAVRSFLAAPVIARSGEVLGGLFFGHPDPGRFTGHHEVLLAGIASQAAIAMDNAQLFEQAQWTQAELKRSNEELRRANQDLETFAYSASHDLKEPLRTIALSAQLLERALGERRGDEEALLLTGILSAAKRMRTLIDDLLTYTRATRYAEGPLPRVDSAVVLAGVLESLRGPIEEAGAVVTSAKLPPVSIHESRLAQLFQNLISNAIKYRSAEVPRVHVSACIRDGWCVFSVADNGIGIEPQYAERIFELFKRLHGREQYPGSGVGLAICQRIVEQYGGRIWLDTSSSGRGSTFCFAVPHRAR